MPAKPLGLAVVGSGRIGTLRATLAAAHPAVNFIAVSDRDPSRAASLAEKVGAQFHTADNLEAISRPEVSAVVVSTLEVEHTEPVLQALWRDAGLADVRARRLSLGGGVVMWGRRDGVS